MHPIRSGLLAAAACALAAGPAIAAQPPSDGGAAATPGAVFAAPSPLAGGIFHVESFSLGYVYDIPVADHLSLGLGAMGTVDIVPSPIRPAYGSNPFSDMVFTRFKIQ